VQLRNHPLFSYRRVPTWPPVWTLSRRGEPPEVLHGEIGVLQRAFANPQIPNKCYLVIQHANRKYVGCVIFDNRSFCREMTEFLKLQVGCTVEQIGDLDVTVML